MLAPRASSAFVCLRCEAQIACSRLPVVARRIPRANFSASARLHDDDADYKDSRSGLDTEPLNITKVVEPLNRLRRRKGKIIKETTASLQGIKRLGDDADILVLREIGDAPTDKRPEEAQVIEHADPVEVPDIASMLTEGKATRTEEVYEQIESMRPIYYSGPDEPNYITQYKYLKLRKRLMLGFNLKQLTMFWSYANNLRRDMVHKGVIARMRREENDSKRPVERSEWQPGTTDITSRLPGVDRHVTSIGWRNKVSKQLLVDRILRDQWNIVLMEEIEAPGELEFFLKPWQMTLLTVGEPNKLDEIAMIRKAKFELYKPHDTLRITADKSTADYAANDVEEALRNTERKWMNLKNYMGLLADDVIQKVKEVGLTTLFSQKHLDAISALTKTSIIADRKDMLTIRGFDNGAIEEARRSLVKLLPLRDAITRTEDMLNLRSTSTSVYPAPTYVDKSLLDYQLRDAALGRLSVPLPRIVEPESTEDAQESTEVPESPKATLQGLVEKTAATILRSASNDFPHMEDLGNWVAEPTRKLHVKFGQALIPLEHADGEEAEANVSERLSKNVFVPTFPGLATFLASPELSITARLRIPTLHYHFQPDSEQTDFETTQLFPALNIKIGTDRDGTKAYLRKASLRFWQHIHTVSLPNKATDLQYYQYGSLRLRTDYNDDNIDKWLAAAQKNIVSGERISAPPITIDIPKWTIPGFSSDEKGMATIRYYFAGVEFRQVVSGSLLGENIALSAKQTSKMSAKGSELSMYYNGHGDTQLRDETAVKAFVKKCHDVADMITHASAQTSSLARQARPRYVASARKLRRAEMMGQASNTMNDMAGEMTRDLEERAMSASSAHEDMVLEEIKGVGNEVSVDEGATLAQSSGVSETQDEPLVDSSSRSS